MIPSICKHRVMSRENFLAIQKKVWENGATLYLSIDFGFIAEFESLTGFRVQDSEKISENGTVTLNGEQIPFHRNRRMYLESVGADILACDNLGIPAIAVNDYGNGKVVYVNFPLETMLLERNDVTDGNYYKIYKTVFDDLINSHPVRTPNPYVGITLHERADGSHYAVAINYSVDAQKPDFIFGSGKQMGKIFHGSTERIPGYDAVIFEVL